MVDIFGTLKSSETRDGRQVTVFTIPAISKRLARRRGQVNARLKDLRGAKITSTRKVRSGQLPGQSIYEVRIVSET